MPERDWKIIDGDCVEAMAAMPEASVDAVVCDPPAGISFMSRDWDHHRGGIDGWTAWFAEVMAEALRVSKPGAHAFVWALPRTSHWTGLALERAGWQVRDVVTHLFGSGFPKSHNLPNGWGTALKPSAEFWFLARKPLAGTVAFNVMTTGGVWVDVPDGESSSGSRREKVCYDCRDALSHLREADAGVGVAAQASEATADMRTDVPRQDDEPRAEPALDGGAVDRLAGLRDRERAGQGADAGAPPRRGGVHGTTATSDGDGASPRRGQGEQPAVEPRSASGSSGAREAPRADRCARCGRPLYGTGALNVDGCRIANTPEDRAASNACMSGDRMWRKAGQTGAATFDTGIQPDGAAMHESGRWPANVVLDPEAARALDEMTGPLPGGTPRTDEHGATGSGATFISGKGHNGFGDQGGGASRFFYVAKSSSAERNAGLDGFEAVEWAAELPHTRANVNTSTGRQREPQASRNHHPTVKPIALMRWLVRLVTPPGGLVLDPFVGSGTTGIAASLEGFRFVGIEREPEYAAIARARIDWWAGHPDGMELVQRLEHERERKAQRERGQESLF